MKLILCKSSRNFSTEQEAPVCIYIRSCDPDPTTAGRGTEYGKDELWTKLMCAPVTFGFIHKDQKSKARHGGTAGLKEITSGDDQTKKKGSWHPERQDEHDTRNKHEHAHHISASGRASPSASASGSGSWWSGISITTKPSRSVTTASGFNCSNVSINICTSLRDS